MGRLPLPGWETERQHHALVAAWQSFHVTIPGDRGGLQKPPRRHADRRRDRRGRFERQDFFQSPPASPLACPGALVLRLEVLIHRGKSVLNVPLQERRALLDDIFAQAGGEKSPLKLSEIVDAPVSELIRVAKAMGFEGILAKRRDSFYESGKRSGAWQKYRVNQGQEFVIGGYVPGNPLDSVIVGYYDDGKLVYVAKVRNGFVPNTDLRYLPNCAA
jgi:hypothetical protein